MLKLVSGKAEEPEIKLPNLLDHRKRKRVPGKHLLLLYWLCQSLCVDHNKLWKILKDMGIPGYLTCFLRNLYVGQKATVRTGHGTTDWFKIGKEVRQDCTLSPGLFNLYAEYFMWNIGLDESPVGIKTAGRNINNFRYANDITQMAESEGTKKPLDEGERGVWKSWLETQHSKN